MGKLSRIAIVALAMVASVACLTPQRSLMAGVDMQAWSESATVVYNNSDTLAMQNLQIALRYNDNFKECTLPLKVSITAPDASHFEEVVELRIGHPRTALAVATTESLPYRNDVVLTQKGDYIFAFTPLTAIRGVEAIGVEFREKTD